MYSRLYTIYIYIALLQSIIMSHYTVKGFYSTDQKLKWIVKIDIFEKSGFLKNWI